MKMITVALLASSVLTATACAKADDVQNAAAVEVNSSDVGEVTPVDNALGSVEESNGADVNATESLNAAGPETNLH